MIASGLPAPSKNDEQWYKFREGALTFPRGRSKKGTKGPRPLAAMCLRVLADNIATAPPGAISELPLELRWRLWKELAPRHVHDLHDCPGAVFAALSFLLAVI